MSMKPGQTTLPVASRTVASGGGVSPRPIRWIRSPSISTSCTRVHRVGGIDDTAVLDQQAHAAASAPVAGQEEEHRHAHRDALGHLIEDHREGAVGDLRGELDPAVHRAGVHDQHVGPGVGAELVERQPPVARVLAQRGDEPAGHPLLLQPQHHDDVHVADGVLEAVGHLHAQLLHEGRDQRGRPGHRHRHAELAHGVDVGAGHAAVGDVADDGDRQPLEVALVLADRQQIEERLGRMLVRAVAGVDDASTSARGRGSRRRRPRSGAPRRRPGSWRRCSWPCR